MNICDEYGSTPLHVAAELGYIKILEDLLKNGANRNAKRYELGDTPLHWAIKFDQIEAVEKLLKYGANVDAIIAPHWFRGRTSLHDAASEGNLENAEFLLEYNANLNAVDDNKCTPLHLATQQNKPKVVKLLLISGGNDINIRNIDGNTALESAFAKNNIKIASKIRQRNGTKYVDCFK